MDKILKSLAQKLAQTKLLNMVPQGQLASQSLETLGVPQLTLGNVAQGIVKKYIYDPEEQKILPQSPVLNYMRAKTPEEQQAAIMSGVMALSASPQSITTELKAPPYGTFEPHFETQMDEAINPLIQEAKKYKSAEEFMKAQGETLYHGTPSKFDTKDFKGGYLTADKKYADVYKNPSASSISYGSAGVENKLSGEPRTLEFVLPKNAKIFDYTNPQHRKLLNDYWGKSSMSYEPYVGKSGQLDWTEGESLREFFDEKGIKFDGIKLDEAGGFDPVSGLEVKRSPSVLVINPKALMDKSQLIDIWNQAQKGGTEAINKALKSLTNKK